MELTIFAGTTGFDKSSFIQNFIKESLKKNGLSDNIHSTESEKFIKYVKFEDELLRADGSLNTPIFLNKNSLKEKSDAIEKTFTRINKQIKEQRNETKYFFLNIHLSYLRNSEFTPPLSLSGFRELVQDDTPVKLITLIDDIYVIHNNLRTREENFPNTKLRLREILSWRSVEMLQAESLAGFYTNENRSVKNYLVSIRHPYATFANLIFNTNPMTAYMSYPISKTRMSTESVNDINKARKELHEIFAQKNAVLFDPVTIDELVLKSELQLKDENVVLDDHSRWPIDDNGLTMPFSWPVAIPEDEIKEVKADIENQIAARDFKLIDTARFTAVYRPGYCGFSTGVNEEIRYSISQGKGVYVYDPPSDEDKSQPKTNPFTAKTVTHTEYDDFLQRIRKTLDTK